MVGFRILPVIVLLVTEWVEGAHKGVNGGEFQAMCRFVKLLKAQVKLPEISLGGKPVMPVQEANAELNRIGDLALATVSDKVFSQLKKDVPLEANSSTAIDDIPKEEWDKILKRWGQREKNADKFNQNPIRSPPGTRRENANRRIVKIYHAVETLAEQVKAIEKNIKDLAFAAQRLQFSAVYGAEAVTNHLGTGTKSTEELQKLLSSTGVEEASIAGGKPTGHAKLCGAGTNSVYSDGTEVGLSMVSDLMCLCAQKTSPAAEDFCGAGHSLSGSQPASDWDTARVGKLKSLAGAILSGCKLDEGEPVGSATPERLMGIVNQFHAMLGKNVLNEDASSLSSNVDYKGQSQFILGAHTIHHSGPVKCSGAPTWSSASHGICINYAHHLGKGNEIPWIRHIIGAIEKIREAEGNVTLIPPILAKIGSLRADAEIYYELTLDDLSSPGHTTKLITANGHNGSHPSPLSGKEQEASNTVNKANTQSVFNQLVNIFLFLGS